MKDCNGKSVGLNDIVATPWSGANLVTGRVVAIAPNHCRVLVEPPHADNKKVKRHASMVCLVEKANG